MKMLPKVWSAGFRRGFLWINQADDCDRRRIVDNWARAFPVSEGSGESVRADLRLEWRCGSGWRGKEKGAPKRPQIAMGSVPSGRREFATTGETEEAEQGGAEEEHACGKGDDGGLKSCHCKVERDRRPLER